MISYYVAPARPGARHAALLRFDLEVCRIAAGNRPRGTAPCRQGGRRDKEFALTPSARTTAANYDERRKKGRDESHWSSKLFDFISRIAGFRNRWAGRRFL
ncbi:hypothetical protein GM658_05280 [Pseudoduganella eburnea]|uniref:Uncharacterized protein n=1 Tax=Massilia eburnea TaxID=1776165 RepID=A0A6L6QEC2_9BURK|nr:hypothetical protein [Massilia eburnea]MTW10006.1 hypothetical protein [Massilia eburnea]